jgi:Ca2+-transporting ATPase
MDGGYVLYKSGAPEEIFASSQVIPKATNDFLLQQTETGRRVIGIACKRLAPDELQEDFVTLETGMSLVGLISFEDAPRPGVKETIAQAATAGIRTIMVTGDHPATASSIARQVGIRTPKVITGDELDRMSDEDLQNTVRTISVFARTTPEGKYRIVKALQANHEVVAATGDGINDVLALKGADIGIAMGKRGTDVAKDAADVVLADDNYNTITYGIFESRGFFDNLLKGMKYYLSIKLALILIFLVPIILYTPMPFSPIQIILLELFMDLAASAGFVAEPKEKDVYTRKPRNPQENLFNRRTVTDIVIKSLFLAAAVTSVFLFSLSRTTNPVEAQAYAFSAWIIGHVEMAYISRSDKESLLSVGIFTNRVMNLWALAAILFLLISLYVPFVNSLLRLAPIPPSNLAMVLVFVTVIILLLEIKKLPVFNPELSSTPE